MAFRTKSINPSKAHLPDEIADMIARELKYSQKEEMPRTLAQCTLASLSLVSKQWHCVVKPYLYRTIVVVLDKGPEHLIATLKANPVLGEHCTTLVASCSAMTDWVWSGAKSDRKACGPGGLNGTTALLPFHLPNLEFLDVSQLSGKVNHGYGYISIPPWVKLIADTWHPELGGYFNFTRLKRIDADIEGMPIANLSHIFALPSIETLNFKHGCMHTHDDGDFWVYYDSCWDFSNPSVKHLSFHGAKPDYPYGGRTLHFLATACPNLESLSFVSSKRYGFGAHLLRAVIASFRDVLQNPDFRCLELWDERPQRRNRYTELHFTRMIRWIMDLSPVGHLNVDDAVIDCLWQPGVAYMQLPKQLKTLHIRSTTKAKAESTKALTQMLENIAALARIGAYEKLEKVTVELKWHDLTKDKAQPWAWNKVKETFESAGVVCELRWGVNVLSVEHLEFIAEEYCSPKESIRWSIAKSRAWMKRLLK